MRGGRELGQQAATPGEELIPFPSPVSEPAMECGPHPNIKPCRRNQTCGWPHHTHALLP